MVLDKSIKEKLPETQRPETDITYFTDTCKNIYTPEKKKKKNSMDHFNESVSHPPYTN